MALRRFEKSAARAVQAARHGRGDAKSSRVHARAIGQIAPLWIDNKNVFALGLKLDDGSVASPTPDEVAAQKYPLVHPVFLVIKDRPTASVRVLIDFMLSARGQQLVKKCGYFGLDDLKPKSDGK